MVEKRFAHTNKSHSQTFSRTMFPVPLSLHINLSQAWNLTDSCAICCTLTLLYALPPTKNKMTEHRTYRLRNVICWTCLIIHNADFFFKIFIAQTVYRVCKRINYRIVPVTNLDKYLHYGTSGTNNMYINIGANNGSEKLWTKKIVISGKLIKAVYALYVYFYISCTSYSGWLEYNSLSVGLGGWGARGNERKICQ